ncbi:MAG: hypothetical protein WCJ31_09625 [Planctomycetia bacterium]
MRRFLSLNSLNVAGMLVAAIALHAGLTGRAAAVSFTSVAYPGAIETDPFDLDGERIVGGYFNAGGPQRGFYFDGTNFNDLYNPAATDYTTAYGISGNTIVGEYYDGVPHGFTYDIQTQTWTTVDRPGASDTGFYDIDGTKIVGASTTSGVFEGFLYEGGNFTSLTGGSLSAEYTFASTIHGDWVGGSYTTASSPSRLAMLYQISTDTYTQFVLPFAGQTFASIGGISDLFITGEYSDASGDHAFAYNRLYGTWLTIDAPGAINGTYGSHVDGDRMAVYGYPADYNALGYIATLPVPEIDPAGASSVLALLASALGLLERRARRMLA